MRALLRRLVSPEFPQSRRNFEQLIALASQNAPDGRRPRVAVIGGATRGQGTVPLYDGRCEVVGVDIYPSPEVSYLADAHDLPFADGSVDAVVLQAVLEHVRYPERAVEEAWRVLKTDGLIYAETPFLQAVHEGAWDFTRWTPNGHRDLLWRFDEINSGIVGGPGMSLLWSIDFLFRGLFRSRGAGAAAKLALFWLRWLDHLIPERWASDACCGVWFMGRKTAGADRERIDPAAYYPGAQ